MGCRCIGEREKLGRGPSWQIHRHVLQIILQINLKIFLQIIQQINLEIILRIIIQILQKMCSNFSLRVSWNCPKNTSWILCRLSTYSCRLVWIYIFRKSVFRSMQVIILQGSKVKTDEDVFTNLHFLVEN